jgi:uncharacterized protein (DUF58 family)
VSARKRPFPLVPRRRLQGTPFGERPSARRGRGADIAGIRPYVPGDPVSTIDWFASARLSTARGGDEFVVRETYAEEAPRVLIVVDRRPSMALYGPDLPWLSKPDAVRTAGDAIARAATAARAELGYADTVGDRTRVYSPGAVSPRRVLERLRTAPFDAPAGSLQHALAALLNRRAELPQGSFVFIVSDFLDPVDEGVWTRMSSSLWDVVPVVVQDPTWEQTFPDVHNVLVPFAPAGGDEPALIRLGPSETAARRRANEERLEQLLRRFRVHGFDPVVLDSSVQTTVDSAFLRWAERRQRRRRR